MTQLELEQRHSLQAVGQHIQFRGHMTYHAIVIVFIPLYMIFSTRIRQSFTVIIAPLINLLYETLSQKVFVLEMTIVYVRLKVSHWRCVFNLPQNWEHLLATLIRLSNQIASFILLLFYSSAIKSFFGSSLFPLLFGSWFHNNEPADKDPGKSAYVLMIQDMGFEAACAHLMYFERFRSFTTNSRFDLGFISGNVSFGFPCNVCPLFLLTVSRKESPIALSVDKYLFWALCISGTCVLTCSFYVDTSL